MILATRCEQLIDNVNRLSSLKGGYDQTKQLQSKAALLAHYKKIVSSCLFITKLFYREKISVELPKNIDTIITIIERIENNFQKDPTIQSLTKSNYWPKFEDNFKNINISFDKIIKTTWNKFIQESLPSETPRNLELSTFKTGKNEKLLKQYRFCFEELESLKRDLPTGEESFQQVRLLSEKSKEAYSQIERDIPNDVGIFLKAINVDGGASLDLLTEEVVKWLKKKNSYQEYKITQ